MKRKISIIAVFAIFFLFLAQNDSYAKTEKQAIKSLGVVNDEEVYNVVKPTVFSFKLETTENKPSESRGSKKIAQEIYLLFKQANDLWRSIVLPVVDPTYKKYVLFVE